MSKKVIRNKSKRKTKKNKDRGDNTELDIKNNLVNFSDDFYNIYHTLFNIYDNIQLQIETSKSNLKATIPSYYKCFLFCVRNHIYYKTEVQHIKKFFDLETIYSFEKDDLNSINLSQKQLTRLNNIVEDECPRLIDAFNPLDPQYNIPEEHAFLYNIYMSFQGFELLRSQMSYKVNVKYQFGDYNGEYNIFIKKKDLLTDKFTSNTSPLLKQIGTRILFYNVYLSTPRIPIFTIYYSNLKKTTITPLNDNKLRSFNVNTAATDTKKKIIIWRREELLKSIFHECNHFHSFDKILDTNMEKINKYIFDSIRIDKQSYSQLELREAYTELIANLLNIIGVIAFRKSVKHTNKTCFNNIIKLLKKEINFSNNQTGKILKHFNFKKAEQFLKLSIKSPKSYKSKYLLSQTTHVISYYILKSILLINIGEILSANNNINSNFKIETSPPPLTFVLNNFGKERIFQLIKTALKEESKWITLINKSMKNKTFKNKTLKMTSVSSDI